jgi:hypothetical protein
MATNMTTMNDEPTTLWTLQRDGKQVACLVRLVPYGIEVDITHDGSVILTRAFETDREALEWADKKRAARESEGWQLSTNEERVKPQN